MSKRPKDEKDLNILINSAKKRQDSEEAEDESSSSESDSSGLNFMFENIYFEEEKKPKTKIIQDEEGSNQDAIKDLTSKNNNKKDENLVGYSSMFHHDYIKPAHEEEKIEKDEVTAPKVVLTTVDGQQVVKPVNTRYKKSFKGGGKSF